MPINRRLTTDQDFQDALDRQLRIRVFHNSHMVESGAIIVRFTEDKIITQTSVSDLTYHSRQECEFFELKKR